MPKKQRKQFFYGYVIALAGFVTWMTAWGTFTTFGVFFKSLLAQFGWTRAMTAGAISLSAITRGSLGIIMGRLTDKLGPRKVILIFGSFLGIGYLLMSQVRSLWQFDAVYALIIGVGLSAVTIPIMATMARWFVKRRGLMIGIVQSGAGVGGMILSPVTGWLIVTYGWRSSYVVLGIIALALIIPAGLFLKRDPSQIGQSPYGADDAKGQGTNKLGPHLQEAGFSFHEALHTRQFWMLFVMLFSFGFCRSVIITHIAAHTEDLGFSLATAAKVMATISGIGIVGRIGMGRLADIIGNRPALIISYTLMAATLLWATTADELWELYLFASAFGFSWGALAAIRMPMLAEIFGLSSIGTILGTIEVGAEIGVISGPFLAGWLFDTTDTYQIAFISASAIAVMGLIMTIFLRPISNEGKTINDPHS